MSDNIFEALDEDRVSELNGEKAKKESEPFSPALIADISISKNYHGNNCLSVILVKKGSVGNYWQYDVQIPDKKALEEAKKIFADSQNKDEEARKKITKANIEIKNLNQHLYDVPGTDRMEKTADALAYLQKALTEQSLEVDVNFTPQAKTGSNYTNHYFRDIKPLNAGGPPINPEVIALIKDDIARRKEFQLQKRKAEQPDQFEREEVQKEVTEENDIPF